MGGAGCQVMELTGAVGRILTRGPRKGRMTWRDADPATKRTVYITPEEHDKWNAAR